MEAHNDCEERLFDLLESKAYESLTPEERRFVDMQMSAADFRLQQRIMREADQIEHIQETPATLVLPVSVSFWKQPLPLYQAILAAAAVFVIFFSLFRFAATTEKPKTLASVTSHDTIFSTKIVHDTVVYTVNQIQYVNRPLADTDKYAVAMNTLEERRLFDSPNTIVLPKLTEELVSTKGKSLMEDPVSQFIPQMIGLND